MTASDERVPSWQFTLFVVLVTAVVAMHSCRFDRVERRLDKIERTP